MFDVRSDLTPRVNALEMEKRLLEDELKRAKHVSSRLVFASAMIAVGLGIVGYLRLPKQG